ncbi:hypothetical protein AOLI_G00163950 [Acnodon oligacanthus]
MWVRAAPGANSPLGPLQVAHNCGTTAGAIAGIPSRNRGALAQGTDTLAAVPQSIHQSVMGVRTAEAQPAHPRSWASATSTEPGILSRSEGPQGASDFPKDFDRYDAAGPRSPSDTLNSVSSHGRCWLRCLTALVTETLPDAIRSRLLPLPSFSTAEHIAVKGTARCQMNWTAVLVHS